MSENLTPEVRDGFRLLVEAMQVPWQSIKGAAARKIDCILIERKFAVRAISTLLTALEEAAEQEKYHGVARFVDAEEIAELMEAGARTWMPMELAKPERNGSIIVMTSDDAPVIGQAFWHEHGDGTWALHWSAVSPKEDCWNDPITETNKGLACWQPMPEGPCEARVKAMGSPSPHMAALLRIKALEDALRKIAESNLGDRAWEVNYAAIREVARADLTTKSGEASR